MARPPPPTTRKPGVSMISAPVLVLDLSIAPAILTTYVDPRPSLDTLQPEALTHSTPATVSRASLRAPDLRPQQQSDKSIGKQRCDDVPAPVNSTPPRTTLDRNTQRLQGRGWGGVGMKTRTVSFPPRYTPCHHQSTAYQHLKPRPTR